MKYLLKTIKSLTIFEALLWGLSLVVIVFAFFITKNTDYYTLAASLVGATALIFLAKGNVLGQILTVLFAVLYGVVSFNFRYYGEMITYLGMTAPVAIAAIVTWLKNPHKGNKADVQINSLPAKEYALMFALGTIITAAFYFILKALDTNNLVLSTISIFTSFIPSYLTVRRSELYAVGYAINDIILIALWIKATLTNLNYLAMVICFVVFFVNDVYGFLQWSKNKKKQQLDDMPK